MPNIFAKRPIQALRLLAVVSTFILLACNLSFWAKVLTVYPITWQTLPFLCSLALTLFCLHYAVLIAFCFKKLLKPLLMTLFVILAVSAYAMDNFGYLMAAQAFQNVFETNYNEISDLLGLKLMLYVALLCIVPILITAKIKIKYPNKRSKVLYIFVLVGIIVVNLAIFNRNYVSFFRNHKEVHYYLNPARPIYSLFKYFAQRIVMGSDSDFSVLDHSPHIAKTNAKPKLVVLVVGESDRSINHSINGYTKLTNPLLSKRNNLYSFSDFHACGTETAVSVPCMFSSFKRHDFNYAKGRYTENVLDLLSKSKVKVVWRDNDNGCKHVCDRVENEDFSNASMQPYCNSFECFDEILLHNLQSYIDRDRGDKLIVLHKKGNHGPAYFKRYPDNFEYFTPVCRSNELQNCNSEEIMNTYDNIVRYTDFFLDSVISVLEQNKEYQTAMLYLSDHGESLGENGIYLHAMPYALAPKEQLHIPFMLWTSEDFEVDREHIQAVRHKAFSHDNLFHSLLGLFKVKTMVYDRELDIFAVN